MNEVNSTTRNTQPYVDIGLIETTWADGTASIGTCSLVGRNDILTAGHCVYNPDAGGWGKNYKFYFGADYNSATGRFENYGENLSFGKWEAIAWTSQIFTDSDDETMLQSESQYDIAVIGVDTPIGDTLGWLGLASGYDGSQTATAVGYPAGSTGMMRETAYVTKSSNFGIYESNVQVMGPGSSGGPLLIDNYVIGVKSTGYSWADIGFLYNNITKAMAENDGLISGAVLDTTPPTIQISTSDNHLTTGEVATIFFKLSESCNDFTLSDITVSGGVLSNFQGSGQNYSAIFTPTTGSAISGYAYVWKNTFSDLSGNFNIDGNDADNRVDITINTLTGASVYESEPNNVLSSATLVSIGGGAKGQLYSSDVDYYKLHITTPGLLSVTFGTYVSPYVGEIGQTNLSIRNDSGIVLSSITAYNGKVLSAQIGAPGDVYIRLSGTSYWAPDTDPYDLSFSFVSSDATPPTVISFNPTDESTDVAVASNFVINFSEAIARGTGNIVLKSSTGAIVATYDAATSSNLSITGSTLTLNPSADLAYSTGYTVEFAAGSVKDIAGNAYAGTTSYNFTTESKATVLGGPGNDILTGGSGVPIDGLAGIDTVTYTGNRGSIVHNANGTWTVGTDTLTNIERLHFSDNTRVALDVTDNALETLQFIGVIAPSLQGNLNVRGTILSLFDQGKSMQEMSQLALDLGLITSDDTALAKTVFKNVFNTTADPDQGLTNTLVNFIEQNGDAKFLATVAGLNINVDLVGLQQHGMEFI